jgi:hypothetical protein
MVVGIEKRGNTFAQKANGKSMLKLRPYVSGCAMTVRLGDWNLRGRRGRGSMKAVAKHLTEPEIARMRRGTKLGEALRESYAAILAEPCPQSMLDLLNELRARESAQSETKD